MRLLRWLSGLVGFLASLYLYLAFVHPPTPVGEHPFFDAADAPPEPWTIAHQGGRGLWPENTLYAFDRAYALGADVLEMDLRVTADGHFVVMHDETVDRTTNGKGRVRELSLAELKELDAGYRFEPPGAGGSLRGKGLRVPRLAEVLSRYDTRFVLEMKSFTPEEARRLCRLLREHGVTERTLIASFGHEAMVAFRDACHEVATSATLREGLWFYQLNRLKLGSLYGGPALALQVPEYLGDRHVLTVGFLELARDLNLRVQVWTVNDESDMKRLVGLGVQGVMTDYPDKLLALLGRSLRERQPSRSSLEGSSGASSLDSAAPMSTSSPLSFLPALANARRSRAIFVSRRSTFP